MLAIAILALGIWLYLLLLHGNFWSVKLPPSPQPQKQWPGVTVIIPARNEAPFIARTVQSILNQDYPGHLRLVLIDDHSTDATCAAALQAAEALHKSTQLSILHAPPLPPDWSGKVWAMQQGFLHARECGATSPYLWFTDADIDHAPHTLTQLISQAEAQQLTLASLMVKLPNHTFYEKLMIPAFIYFFKILYPFAWINRPNHPRAGAAGGAMLVRHTALQKLGGLACIRGALIDDCALGRALKQQGPIWLSLTATSVSTRGYSHCKDIWMMIARTAYTQLHHQPLLLLICVLGLTLTFLLPVGLTLWGPFPVNLIAASAWGMMTLSYLPILKLYQQNYLWAPLLPITASIYLCATLDSARRYYMGKGGHWKGRAQAKVSSPRCKQ